MSKLFFSIFCFCLLSLYSAPEVQIGIESQEVYLNEPFLFQIKVSGQQECPPPALPAMQDFTVTAEAPSRKQHNQISIINGRRSRSVSIETIFNYNFTPKRLGTLQIPSISVTAEGVTKRTQPIQVVVIEPEIISGMSLELHPSSRECYVGEPVLLTWRWFIDRQVYNYLFDLPLFTKPEFTFPEYIPEIDPQRERQYQRIGNRQEVNLIALQSKVSRQGKSGVVLTFDYPLIPNQAGVFALPESSVICDIQDNRPKRSNRRTQSPFGDFFFANPRTTRKLSLTAAPVTLTVKELPLDNQPDNFSGIIGNCKIEVTVEPTEVNVGDPMLLTIALTGPRFLEPIRLPPLEQQGELARNFKISGAEPGLIKNNRKLFQRTLRASNPDVSQIPALEIAYFNSSSGIYEIAQSQPIAIKVSAARQVTLQDAQGLAVSQADLPVGRELQLSEAGIAHNYEVEKLLTLQNHDPYRWLTRPSAIVALAVPPGLWLALLAFTAVFRRHNANPRALASRRAAGKCLQALKRQKADSDNAANEVFTILQNYFRDKFQLNPGVVTYADLINILASRNYLAESGDAFREVLAACEASRFAGNSLLPAKELVLAAIQAVKRLEKGK